jgi:hypothetical protein
LKTGSVLDLHCGNGPANWRLCLSAGRPLYLRREELPKGLKSMKKARRRRSGQHHSAIGDDEIISFGWDRVSDRPELEDHRVRHIIVGLGRNRQRQPGGGPKWNEQELHQRSKLGTPRIGEHHPSRPV